MNESSIDGDTSLSGSSIFIPSEYFVSTHVQKITEICVDLILSLAFALFGIVGNILIIVVFAKQGFKDTVNISMTSIAIWDLIKCLSAAMQRMAGPLNLINPADAESWSNVSLVVFNYLICFSSYVSSVLAAFVAVERCLCVSMPFKVKDIITPKVTLIACVMISLGVFGAFAVVWSIYDIRWVFHPVYNRSIMVYQNNDFFYKSGGSIFEYYNLSGMIWPIVCFMVINVCTVVIVYNLRKSSSFRKVGGAGGGGGGAGGGGTGGGAGGGAGAGTGESSSSSTRQDNGLSRRDRQVVKMLLVIIVVYIVSLSPRIIVYLAKYFIYEFYYLRLYHNLFTVIGYIVLFFDIFNATVNIFIFLFMSSNFRSTFTSLFSCWGAAKSASTKILVK